MVNRLLIPCKTGQVSDGYHTFDELYEHRCILFVALCLAHPDLAWKARQHADGSEMPGWFIAGMKLPTGDVTYHLPDDHWDLLRGVKIFHDGAPAWDGHTSEDVVNRLRKWIQEGA